MITRYFINGVFLFVLYILLFHNTNLEAEKELPTRSFNYLFSDDIHPDTIIQNLKNEHLLISEMDQILARVMKDSLSETMNGLAIMYGVSKKAQIKINEGVSNETLDRVITFLGQNTLIVEIPKSDWSKFKEYFQQCLFENLRCDHLLNRVTTDEYFPAALVFCSLLMAGILFLLFRRKIMILLTRIKLRRNETIDHTIPFNPSNQ